MTSHATLTRDEILQILRSTAGRAESLGAGFSTQHLTTPPGPGEWSMAQVIGHLVLQEEKVLLPRFRRTLAEDVPTFESSQGLADNPAPGSFAAEIGRFRELRLKTLALLEGLTEDGWQRRGRRPSRPDPVSVETYALYAAEHDLDHLKQLEATTAIIGC